MNSPAEDTHDQANRISIRNLSLRAGKTELLRSVNAEFSPGGITLIVGPSGVGKTVLLRTIAAVGNDPEIQVQGRVLMGNRSMKAGDVGVVFQDFALFEELSPRGNIEFALAHAASGSRQRRTADQWMRELNIPANTRTRNLSGGQRQRLAIARALAAYPNALVYDEPTSGLDPQMADQVAALIQQTSREYHQTTIVVTHDYRSLVPIADRILIIDPVAKQLLEVPQSDWPQLGERLAKLPSEEPSGRPSRTRRFTQSIWDNVSRFFEQTTTTATELLLLVWSLLPAWRSFKWGPYFFAHYLRLVAGPSAWIYLMIAGAILGFVTTYFTFRFLPYASYTEPLLIDNLLGAMGFALYRILVPILGTVLIAARCGAAVASDVGGKKYGRQLEALQSLRVRPRRYLLTGILHAFLLGTPTLVAIAYITSSICSMGVFVWVHPELGANYWRLHFHRELYIANEPFFEGTGWLIAKVLVCAIGIALIAYHRGAAPKNSPSDVSNTVTSTILWTTLYVLVVHFLFAFFEFKVMGSG